MRPVQGVHTHLTPEGRISQMNKSQKKIGEAPIRNNAGIAVREFPRALCKAKGSGGGKK